jgi:hypothetical protein
MAALLPVTLQVNVAPLDYPCVRRTLPHQLKLFAPVVDEILLTFDLRRNSVTYSQVWEDRRPLLRNLLQDCRNRYPNVRVVEVDYSPTMDQRVARQFLGHPPVPHADAGGGPFYAYLFGLYVAKNDSIIHLDGQMIVGGGGAADWLEEAAKVFEARADVVGISPLPGPPAPDGKLREPPEWWKRDTITPGAYSFNRFTMRAIFIQRARFIKRLGPLGLRLAAPLHVLSGWSAGHPPYRALDVTVSHDMKRKRLVRLAFEGPTPGLWTLHPKVHSPTLVDHLPDVVSAVERNLVPAAQLGDGELQDALPDWRNFAPQASL